MRSKHYPTINRYQCYLRCILNLFLSSSISGLLPRSEYNTIYTCVFYPIEDPLLQIVIYKPYSSSNLIPIKPRCRSFNLSCEFANGFLHNLSEGLSPCPNCCYYRGAQCGYVYIRFALLHSPSLCVAPPLCQQVVI